MKKHVVVEFARDQVTQGIFSITRICQLTGLSKNTYYHHQHQDQRFTDKFEHLKTKVKKIIKGNSAYGVKRIAKALKNDYQIEIGRDALSRLLKLWALGLKRKLCKNQKSVVKKILESLSDRVNLLIRSKITKSFQALTTDITKIIYNHGKSVAYLSVHKDVLGQMVYGWSLAINMETPLVIESFKKATTAIKKLLGHLPKDLLQHQDQGSQYTSYEYVNLVLKMGLTLSYSTPGTPTDNPGQESFFGRLKDESRDEFLEMETLPQLKKLIQKKMNYYNNRRLHTSIGLQSPKKFTQDFLKNQLIEKR